MKSHNLESYTLPISNELLKHCKEANSRYQISLKQKAQSRVNTEKDSKVLEINTEISLINQKVELLKNTITQLKQDADKYSFEAEQISKLEDVKFVLSKSNALKRAAIEKQENLDQMLAKKKILLRKKDEI